MLRGVRKIRGIRETCEGLGDVWPEDDGTSGRAPGGDGVVDWRISGAGGSNSNGSGSISAKPRHSVAFTLSQRSMVNFNRHRCILDHFNKVNWSNMRRGVPRQESSCEVCHHFPHIESLVESDWI